MKVYLLYGFYDDGECYASMSWNDLIKIVDSEEKAKKWIFEQAVEKCNKLANEIKEWLDRGEDHSCYREELAFYQTQLDKLKFGDGRYVIDDFNGYEKYGFTYEIKEVE